MSIAPLVKDLLIQGVLAGTAVRTAKKTSVGVAYYGLAGAVGCLALVFFSIAGYGLLLESYSMPVAAALTGAVVLVLSLSIGLYGYLSLHGKKKIIKKPEMDQGLMGNIENTLKSVMDGFDEPVRENPKMALLMAALAGFAAGDRLH